MLKLITILFLFCLPAFSQDGKERAYIVISRATAEAVAEAKVKGEQWDELIQAVKKRTSAKPETIAIVLDLSKRAGDTWESEIDSPSPQIPEWLGKEIEAALFKALEAAYNRAASVTVTLPSSPCHSQTLRGEACTGEMRRLHPLNGSDVEKAKRP